MIIASASQSVPVIALNPGRNEEPWIGAWLLMLGNLYAGPYYADLFARHGLLRDEVAAITCIRMAGCVTSQDIVNFTGRPKNSVARAVRSLEQKAMLTRRDSETDRRAFTVCLTPTGESIFAEIRAVSAQHDAAIFSALTPVEFSQFDSLVHKLLRAYR